MSVKLDCSGCPGLCCQAFTFPDVFNHEHLLKVFKEENSPDNDFWMKNLVYLGMFTQNPKAAIRGSNPHGPMTPFYTCKQLGPDNRCMDYENRPVACRSFGVNKPTNFIGCPYCDESGRRVHMTDEERAEEDKYALKAPEHVDYNLYDEDGRLVAVPLPAGPDDRHAPDREELTDDGH